MITVRAHTRRRPLSLRKQAMNIILATDAAMNEAARDIESWAGRFVPLEQVGIEGEQAQRLREAL